MYRLKARNIYQEETSIARERFGKHVSKAMDTDAAIEELL
jgi:hypothetical protein